MKKNLMKVFAVILTLTMLMTVSAVSLSASAANQTLAQTSGEFYDYYADWYNNEVSSDDEIDDDYFEDYGVYYYYSIVIGDANFDGVLTIKDATIIQKYLANIVSDDEIDVFNADVTGDGDITIKDATAIQKKLANFISNFEIEPKATYTADVDNELNLTVYYTGFADITLVITEDGYYEISATDANGDGYADIDFTLCDEDCYYIAGSIMSNDKSFISTYLTAGTYRVAVTGWCDSSIDFVFSALSADEYYEALDFDNAPVLEIGTAVELTADGEPVLYKLATGDETAILYTDDENINVTYTMFDEFGNLVEVYSGVGSMIEVFDYSYYSYVAICADNESAVYTVKYVDYVSLFKEDAVAATLDEVYLLDTDTIEYEVDGETVAYTFAFNNFSFTPDVSGYYSFNFNSDAFGMVGYNFLSEYSTENDIYSNGVFSETEGINGFGCEYMEAGVTYYVSVVAILDSSADVTVTFAASDEAAYDQAHSDDFNDDLDNYLFADAQAIEIGDSIDVELADEFDYTTFVFTATEDTSVVLYSENSNDVYVDVYDNEGYYITYADDNFEAENCDFVLAGDVLAGETYYFVIQTYVENGDSFTVNLVNYADFI